MAQHFNGSSYYTWESSFETTTLAPYTVSASPVVPPSVSLVRRKMCNLLVG